MWQIGLPGKPFPNLLHFFLYRQHTMQIAKYLIDSPRAHLIPRQIYENSAQATLSQQQNQINTLLPIFYKCTNHYFFFHSDSALLMLEHELGREFILRASNKSSLSWFLEVTPSLREVNQT